MKIKREIVAAFPLIDGLGDELIVFADPNSDGDCEHMQPMWGACSVCRRIMNFDLKYIPGRTYKIIDSLMGRKYEIVT